MGSDQGDLFHTVVGSRENFLLVLEGIQKVDATSIEQSLPQVLRPEVGVDPGRQDYSKPSVGPQQVPERLGEHLVGVEVGTALKLEGVSGIGVAEVAAA